MIKLCPHKKCAAMISSSFLLEDEELHCAPELVCAPGLAELVVSLNAYVGSAHFFESPVT